MAKRLSAFSLSRTVRNQARSFPLLFGCMEALKDRTIFALTSGCNIWRSPDMWCLSQTIAAAAATGKHSETSTSKTPTAAKSMMWLQALNTLSAEDWQIQHGLRLEEEAMAVP